MTQFSIDTITEAVVAEYTRDKSSPRRAEIMGSLIRHLHAFVKEVKLTDAEWMEGIQFLTATGKMCDDKRQEFILLSDTLGVSMLVISINHPGGEHGTESTVLGPFYVEGAPELPLGANIIKRDVGGERTLVQGTVRGPDGKAIAGATVDVWQTAANRLYDVQDSAAPEFNLRGKFKTDAAGHYVFVTEKPVSYSIPTDGPVGRMLKAASRHGMRPAHVHFIVTAPGYRPLTTHVFVNGDQYLHSDAVFATKDALVADFKPSTDAALGARYGLQTPFTRLDFDFTLVRA